MSTNDSKPKILIVDDEAPIRDLLSHMLAEEYDCFQASSAEEAIEVVASRNFDLVISDVSLGGMTGVEMVPRLSELMPDLVVMMISGAHSMDTAIEAMRVGVFDYVRKPFNYDQVIEAVRRGIEHRRALLEKRRHESELSSLVEQRTAELHQLSNYDPLTGLPNEAGFRDLVDSYLGSTPRGRGALLFISLPNLQLVQNTFGPETAKRITIEAANRLRGVVEDDFVSKLEGNRFGCWLPDADSDEAAKRTIKVLEVLRPVFVANGNEIHVHTNIGGGIFPDDGDDYRRLAQSAGVALARAEADGPSSYHFYSAEISAQAIERLKLETGLRRAIERNELSLRYQPKVSINTRQVVGVEALMRWNSAEYGAVSPAVFIPIAEATDLISSIGEWGLMTACRQACAWQEMGFRLPVAVNLSARQFQKKDLAITVWDILRESGLEPHLLNLEVTESSLVHSPATAIEVLTKLQKIGINISIDDFGTGHSSLSYLRSLPMDVLKVDKSFVGNIPASADATTLVRTIITLAHDLRLTVVAEGVETEEQLRVLTDLGCDEWQGFLYSAPLPADEFEALLRNER